MKRKERKPKHKKNSGEMCTKLTPPLVEGKGEAWKRSVDIYLGRKGDTGRRRSSPLGEEDLFGCGRL